MIHPANRLKQLWDLLVMVVTVFSCIEFPLRVIWNYEPSLTFRVIDVGTAVILMADVVLHFYTGFYHRNQVVMKPKIVRAHYLKGWFAIDLISSLPIDLIFSALGVPQVNILLRLPRALRILRLFRLAQMLGKLNKTSSINQGVLRLINLVFWILLGSHFVACIWIYLGSGNAAGTNAGFAPDDNVRNYIRAYYWVTTTIVTIGYGDIAPVTNVQTIFTMVIQLIGAGIYGFVIGNIANVLANLDLAKTQFQEKMERISLFMKYRKIPSTLQEKIHGYYDYIWDTRRGYDEFSVLGELPSQLKTEVSMFLNKDIIEKVPIFKGADESLIREIVLHLKPVVFSPGDYIFRKGETGFEMYFISRGTVDVVSEDGATIYATLHGGSFFGEIAILLSMPRTASVRAQDFCDLYMLDKATFDKAVAKFPDFAEGVKKLAEERKNNLTAGKK